MAGRRPKASPPSSFVRTRTRPREGTVHARRFKLEEGEGVLTYLCIWELENGSPLHSDAYKAQRRRPSALRDRAYTHITQRMRGLYKQIYPSVGAFEDHSGFHPERQQGEG